MKEKINDLQEIARCLRQDIFRMVHEAGDGHPGPSLSAVDLIVALYFSIMKVDPQNPGWPDRDRFILSKGHACPALYAALARKGYFPSGELSGLRTLGSILQGHPDMKRTPGVDATSGSLGNGISLGLGMALAARLKKQDYRTYVITGDGELEEGIVWEAAMAAKKYRAASLTVFVDNNGLQSSGNVAEVGGLYPLKEKWEAFGWHCLEIDGHDFEQVLNAAAEAKGIADRPSVILARTVKGKGIPFVEGDNSWHKRVPTAHELQEALRMLGGKSCEKT